MRRKNLHCTKRQHTPRVPAIGPRKLAQQLHPAPLRPVQSLVGKQAFGVAVFKKLGLGCRRLGTCFDTQWLGLWHQLLPTLITLTPSRRRPSPTITRSRPSSTTMSLPMGATPTLVYDDEPIRHL